MPDVSVRITTTGAEQAVQSFNSVAQASQQFATTTQATVTQARIATHGLSLAIFEVARIARLSGPAGKEFANGIEGVIIAAIAAKGVIGLWRAETEAHILITKIATAVTAEFAAVTAFLTATPLGLAILALAAIAAAAYFYKRQIDANIEASKGLTDATKEQTRAHESNIISLGKAAEAHIKLTAAQQKVREEIEVYLRIRAAREHADRVAVEAEDALKKALPLQELQEEIRHEHALDEIRTVMVPHALALAAVTADVITEAKEATVVHAAQAAAQERLNASLEPTIHASWRLVGAMKGVVTEARDVTTSAADADRVLKVTAEHAAINWEATAQKMGQSMQSAVAGILQVTTQGADIFSNLWVSAVNEVIAAFLRLKEVQSFFTSIAGGILHFFGFQHGGSFIATSPTPIMVGESGAEEVNVRPLAGSPSRGGSNVTINITGPVDEITWARHIRRLKRELA